MGGYETDVVRSGGRRAACETRRGKSLDGTGCVRFEPPRRAQHRFDHGRAYGHVRGVLADLAGRTVRAGILVTGKVVMQEGTGHDDEAVHNHHCKKRGVRGPVFGPAWH